ncbi:hypothetical protein ACFVRD_41225 [Streptomyces sp. NPDC057908]|uniref:hypothetical protein n=1 Tax=Streptomyces sp. NPDC057908 TaxID=3346276 RepID=UPI0036EF3AC4
MTRTAPQHGERRCYLRGCRQPECVAANKRYCKQYRVATIHHPVRIDAAPLAAHLDNLVNQGFSHRQIADAAGRHDGEITKIRSRQQATTIPGVAHAYLNVRLNGITPAHATANAIGTIRRAQALHAIGYPLYRIADGIPMAGNHLGRILDRQPPTVRLTVANGMTALYEQLRWKPGPSRFAVFSARRREWHGPMAWDGNIDEPGAQPEVLEAYKPLPRNGRDSMRVAEIRHLLRLGESPASIARQMQANEKYIRDLISQNHLATAA